MAYLEKGQPAPGGWVTDERGMKTWSGEMSWTTRHGGAEVDWLLGQPQSCRGVDNGTGDKIAVQACVMSEFLNRGTLVFRYKSDDRWIHGRIAIADDGVTFEADDVLISEEETEANGLEQALYADNEIKALVQNEEFATGLYAAMCNVDWQKEGETTWSCSWRYAGGIVAKLRGRGEYYLDFYCSGNEGKVASDVQAVLARLGWHPQPMDDII